MIVEMMFHPIRFVGWAPSWGWPGVIPANAPRKAKIAVDLMLTKLLRVEDIFAKLDARCVAAAMEHRLEEMLEQIITEVMLDRAPRVPNFRSSPWIRGAPQPMLVARISRMSLRRSASMAGRPGLGARLFQRQ